MSVVTLATEIGELLKKGKLTIACAESCTGGLLMSTLTDIAGSSAYVKGGVVCYTNEAKINLCGVKKESIEQHTEVSQKVAGEMARGIKERFNADYGIGITGVAGPGPDANGHPEGEVHIGISTPTCTVVSQYHFKGTRREIKKQCVIHALEDLKPGVEIIVAPETFDDVAPFAEGLFEIFKEYIRQCESKQETAAGDNGDGVRGAEPDTGADDTPSADGK